MYQYLRLRSTLNQSLEFPEHRLPVCTPPVDAVATGAFHILLLGLKNIGGHTVFYLLFVYFSQMLVAFEADGEGFELAVKIQAFDYLAHLLFRLVAFNENGFKPTAGDHPPFHNVGIFGEKNPLFGQC